MGKQRLSDGIEKNEFLTQTFKGYYIRMDEFGACSFCAMGVPGLSTGKMTIQEMLNDTGELLNNVLKLSYFNFDLTVELLDEVEAKFDLANLGSRPLSVTMFINYVNKPTLFSLVMFLNDAYKLSLPKIKEIVRYIEDQAIEMGLLK